jgi:phosphatidylcholine synthase
VVLWLQHFFRKYYEINIVGEDQIIDKPISFSTRLYQLRAWGVHFYTGLGLFTGLFALQAIFAGEVQLAFMWLAAAAIIDSTDGTMARRFDVKRWTPQFDGCLLDNIIDYLNYTFIPVVFAYRFELVPPAAIPVLGLVLIAAAYGFCNKEAKTADGYFTGFPNYWNVMFFYFYLLQFPPAINALIILFFVVMVFIPIRYISASTKPLRHLTIAIMTVLWIVFIIIGINIHNVDMRLVVGSLAGAVYYFAASFYLHFKTSCSENLAEPLLELAE